MHSQQNIPEQFSYVYFALLHLYVQDDCCIMTGNDKTIMANFEEQLYRLVHEYKQKEKQNKELAAAIQEKENTLCELQQRVSALENNYNNLKHAKILSLNDAAIEETKGRISRLVREIDRCIESLKK